MNHHHNSHPKLLAAAGRCRYAVDAVISAIDELLWADIDELVDWQLSKFERRSGYDHSVGQPTCHRCERDWHGLPRRCGARIDSPVLCPPSFEEGPKLPVRLRQRRQCLWVDSVLALAAEQQECA